MEYVREPMENKVYEILFNKLENRGSSWILRTLNEIESELYEFKR